MDPGERARMGKEQLQAIYFFSDFEATFSQYQLKDVTFFLCHFLKVFERF
jgi:hypothetical protein